MVKQDFLYAVIVFLENEKKPKKWERVNKLNGFSLFLNQKFPSWKYMNVYDCKTSKFIKQLRNGDFIPATL